jgi:hypothetical protein
MRSRLHQRCSEGGWKGWLSALAVGATAGCAGLVGITDVPAGDAGVVVPALDGGLVRLPDGRITGLDGFIAPPGPDGTLPRPDGTAPNIDGATAPDGTVMGPDTGPGPSLTYQPSNTGSLTFNASTTGPLTLNADNCVISTDNVTISCASGQNPSMDMATVTLPSGGGQAVVFTFTYISIDADSALQIQGTLPGILVALGSLDLQGSIDVSADNYDSDSDINVIPGARSTGAGVGGFGNSGGPQGGGGGSFCGTGGHGAPGTTGFAPGATYGNATLVPLVGGSAGGGASSGGADAFSNGQGGGALQISAGGTLTVHAGAWITVNGSGGISQGNEQGEGGGSGGSILLEAPTVEIDGVLEANGGEGSDENSDGLSSPIDGGVATRSMCLGGNGSVGAMPNGSAGSANAMGYGGGGGGAGWIRINGTNVTVTVTPSVGSGCASQGTLP